MIVRETHPEPALAVYASRWRLGLLAVAGVAFVVVGVWMTLASHDTGDVVMGAFCAVFFGAATLVIVRLLVQRHPVLRVTSTGVTYRGGFGAATFVPWSAIDGIRIRRFGKTSCLAVDCHDIDRAMAGMSVWRRRMARVGHAFSGCVIAVPTAQLPGHRDELIAEINTFRPVAHRPPD